MSAAPDRLATLDEWLGWLETLHPKAIDLSLNRITTVLEALSLTDPPYHVVTVGGTNGKGSCVEFLESIYRAAGTRVGAFTSPHLWRFNERIRVDGAWASDSELISAFEALEAARGRVTLSYFESSAVAAILHFAQAGVDVAVMEVGLGGRLDAVNAIDPDVSLITSIGLDHMEWLGDDRESIAYEKAGIMRDGCPVVIAEPDPPKTLAREVARRGARALWLDRDYCCVPDGERWIYRGPAGEELLLPRPSFGADEQLVNAAASVTAVRALDARLPVDDRAIATGIAAARLEGRLDRRTIDGVGWIFDVAHNPQAASHLARTVCGGPLPASTLAIFGAMADKDLDAILELFVADVDVWHLAPVASARTADARDLAERLLRLGSRARLHCHDDIPEATEVARSEARCGDRVLVFGSFYTVGPAMESLGLYSPTLGSGMS
jgi:dihydrofolate synthase/folylpolyglutamate synthase